MRISRALLGIFLLAVPVSSTESATDQSSKSIPDLIGGDSVWKGEASELIGVFYHGADPTLAKRVLDEAKLSLIDVSERIGTDSYGYTKIYLPSSDEEFETITGGAIPEWGAGCAFPQDSLIILKPKAIGAGNMREILTHELTHVVLERTLKEKWSDHSVRVPRWFNEGLAMYLSGEWRLGQSVSMAFAALTGGIIPLDKIDSVLTFSSSKAQQAYMQSFLAALYLVKLSDEDVFRRLVAEMTAGATFEQAIVSVLGISLDEFERGWRRYLEDRFGFVSLATDSFTLWVGMSLLFILVYALKKMRAKRIMKGWEMEDNREAGY